MTTTKIKPPGKAYLKLIERFPLRRIRSEEENRAALAIVDELMAKGEEHLSKDELEYLDLLSEQIEKFEKATYWLDRQKLPAGEHIKILMKEHKLTQVQLAEKLGVSQSNIAHILGGKQKLSLDLLEKLSKLFHVSPAIFLDGE